jgi:hypothetical protein
VSAKPIRTGTSVLSEIRGAGGVHGFFSTTISTVFARMQFALSQR